MSVIPPLRARFISSAAVRGWQPGVRDRDVYLHTLPMFHCNGWGMPYAMTAMGGQHIVLRKVDGPEILRRVENHGVTLLSGAPAVLAATSRAARSALVPLTPSPRARHVSSSCRLEKTSATPRA